MTLPKVLLLCFGMVSAYQKIGSGLSLADGAWHHIAFTFDDVANSQILYIDGAVAATAALSASIDYATTGFTTTRIGAHVNDLDENFDFNGLIDDARIYSRVLSEDEIINLATNNSTVSGNVAITVSIGNELVVAMDNPISTDENVPLIFDPTFKRYRFRK